MGQTLSEPVTQKKTTSIKNNFYYVGSSSMQGWRLSMEDMHIQLLDLPEDPGTSYFGVFDGHGGATVARYAGQNLLRFLLKRPEYQSDTKCALKKAFLDCDNEILASIPAEEVGSTAVVLLIKNNQLYCANLGDSRAVACIDGQCVPLSEDHKPNNDIEKKRISEAGCWVTANRINGNLALSRAFGDFCYKRNLSKHRDAQAVIARPDVLCRPLSESWEFVVLACDGIWDVMQSEDVIKFCRERIGRNMSIEKICEELLDCCLSPTVPVTGSGGDNMTVIIVCFLHQKGYAHLAQRCSRKDKQVVSDMQPGSNDLFEYGIGKMNQKNGMLGSSRANIFPDYS